MSYGYDASRKLFCSINGLDVRGGRVGSLFEKALSRSRGEDVVCQYSACDVDGPAAAMIDRVCWGREKGDERRAGSGRFLFFRGCLAALLVEFACDSAMDKKLAGVS